MCLPVVASHRQVACETLDVVYQTASLTRTDVADQPCCKRHHKQHDTLSYHSSQTDRQTDVQWQCPTYARSLVALCGHVYMCLKLSITMIGRSSTVLPT